MSKKNYLTSKELHLARQMHGTKSSAHMVDFNTYTLQINSIDESKFTSWISKYNKHPGKPGELASILEVAFSEIARLLMVPGTTPPTKIIKSDENTNQIVGVASENMNALIAEKIKNRISIFDADGQQINLADDIKPSYDHHISLFEKNPLNASERRKLDSGNSDSDEQIRTQINLQKKNK